MKAMKRREILILAVILCSCNKFNNTSEIVDLFTFNLVGGTIFSSPSQVTMKEIHLDKGILLGQEVVIEGKIVEVGRYNTYMVMTDKTARMLVVLTNLNVLEFFGNDEYNRRSVKILGVIDYGNKGLPYVLAKGILVNKKAV